MTTEIKLTGRVRSMSIPTKKGTMLSFSVLCPENTEDLKRLMSRRVTLSIAEANGHETQEVLPLPVVEAEKPAPQTVVAYGQPMGKPRMTRQDQWLVGDKMREVVARYWAYAQLLRDAFDGKFPEEISGMKADFYIAFPKSYPVWKRLQLDGKPHEEMPDIDNLLKGAMDALVANDEIIAEVHARKFWTNGQPRTEITFY
jgi:Holliday junction resolvase RusA-like endonuclease